MQTAATLEMALDVNLSIDIKAKPEKVFDALIETFTNMRTDEKGTVMKFKLECWPGGRWYRDLGDDKGHLWGIVQSYRPPTLLEFFGPMCMSHPVAGHIIIRLAEVGDATRVTFRHQAMGNVIEEHRQGMPEGWRLMLEYLRKDCET
ncbi:MAG: SRPBCC domain-containing protein [Candidatus Hydrogenedentes bacterium]|nr:SRPBCC domain-containing protein [Candidatus Hydrogenedentota bacterium]